MSLNLPFLADSSSNFLTPSGLFLGVFMLKGTGSRVWVPTVIGVGWSGSRAIA